MRQARRRPGRAPDERPRRDGRPTTPFPEFAFGAGAAPFDAAGGGGVSPGPNGTCPRNVGLSAASSAPPGGNGHRTVVRQADGSPIAAFRLAYENRGQAARLVALGSAVAGSRRRKPWTGFARRRARDEAPTRHSSAPGCGLGSRSPFGMARAEDRRGICGAIDAPTTVDAGGIGERRMGRAGRLGLPPATVRSVKTPAEPTRRASRRGSQYRSPR